jgi:hypothetical protein
LVYAKVQTPPWLRRKQLEPGPEHPNPTKLG